MFLLFDLDYLSLEFLNLNKVEAENVTLIIVYVQVQKMCVSIENSNLVEINIIYEHIDGKKKALLKL